MRQVIVIQHSAPEFLVSLSSTVTHSEFNGSPLKCLTVWRRFSLVTVVEVEVHKKFGNNSRKLSLLGASLYHRSVICDCDNHDRSVSGWI